MVPWEERPRARKPRLAGLPHRAPARPAHAAVTANRRRVPYSAGLCSDQVKAQLATCFRTRVFLPKEHSQQKSFWGSLSFISLQQHFSQHLLCARQRVGTASMKNT